MGISNQQNDESLADKQRMRLSRIQDDLMRIIHPLPSRSCLENRGAFDNASRHMPFERGQRMNRDAAKAARRLPQDVQDEFKAAAIVFYQTLLEDALEPLGQPAPRTDVVNLFQKAEKEECEAKCAIAVALQAPTPSNDQAAAREVEEAVVSETSLATALRNRGRSAWNRINA